MLDLAYTAITPDVFNTFMQSTEHSTFPKNLRYVWIEGTYNLTDKELSKLSFWNNFKSENFDFMEML